jgi:thiol-disulfide isomerase/thioredoxin
MRGAVRAPRLPATSGPWLNGPPLTAWRGAVTLVDFWTYSCINCLRTLPALRAWHAAYAPAGLTILGVHTPEFPFEHESGNVARALRELDVAYPVVLDNERAIWGAFANRAWPHRYLIDRAGRIVHDHAGEGAEAATERAIRAALAADGHDLPTPVYLAPDGAPLTAALASDDAPGTVCVPGSPELFAGYYRGVSGNAGGFREDRAFDYTDPGDRREGYINLTGRWLVDADAAHFVGPDAGALRLAFRGTAPNIVLAPPADRPVEVEVVLAEESGTPPTSTRLVVDAPRLYRLPPAAWRLLGACDSLRTLTIAPQGPGLAVYSFTFAACG